MRRWFELKLVKGVLYNQWHVECTMTITMCLFMELSIAVNIQVSFPDWYLPNYILQNIVET